MKIGINIRNAKAIKFLDNAARQMPFIQASAINSTLILAQKEQRDLMEKNFNIRRPKFKDLSIKIKPFANKRTLKGTISIDPPGGSKNDVFSKFEKGGNITAFGGGRKAIPTSTVQPDRDRVIVRSKRPRRLRESGKSFVLELKNRKSFIVKLVGRGKSKALAFLYQLKKPVRIDPRLEFRKTIKNVVFKNFEKEWAKAFKRVLG